MKVEVDVRKGKKTLAERGLDLDLARVGEVFTVNHFTAPDLRVDYGEDRDITVGTLDWRMVVMVWTPRGQMFRVISMSKANEREQAHYEQRLD